MAGMAKRGTHSARHRTGQSRSGDLGPDVPDSDWDEQGFADPNSGEPRRPESQREAFMAAPPAAGSDGPGGPGGPWDYGPNGDGQVGPDLYRPDPQVPGANEPGMYGGNGTGPGRPEPGRPGLGEPRLGGPGFSEPESYPPRGDQPPPYRPSGRTPEPFGYESR